MARTLTTNVTTELAKTHGIEPVQIIEIQWTLGGQRHTYASVDLPTHNVDGRLLSMSALDFVINVDSGSDSSEITLELSDHDGHLKQILNSNDIHKRDVWVYYWFKDLASLDDKVLAFRGEINSPISWNEGARSLTFDVVSKIEDAEIGFSIEEGDIVAPSSGLIGTPWPLKFGTTINVPALRLTSPATGTLATGTGISDFTLPYKITAAERIVCPQTMAGYRSEYTPSGISLIITPVMIEDQACALSRCETIRDLKIDLIEQQSYEVDNIFIIGGETFPQDTQITLDIDGGFFSGKFVGSEANPTNEFEITSRQHPALTELGVPDDDTIKTKLISKRLLASCDAYAAYPPPSAEVAANRAAELSTENLNAIESAGFFWAKPGSTVKLADNEEVVYVSNLVPETIKSVSVYQKVENGEELVTLDPTTYTTRTTDFDSYMVSEIVFTDPPSKLNEDWSDDIYVTSVSTVGPNTLDIMAWLINKYTDFSIDTTSFDAAKIAVANYPSDFPILDRRNVLTVLREIAFQCRCAIYLRDGTFFFKYLPSQDSSVATITESDVNANTLILSHTSTEDLVTKLTATWKRDYAVDSDNKIILRHNVKKYGVQEEVFDFYIYNELDYVHKSATFWLIRKSNTWRTVRFSTPLQLLKLETFDTTTLDLEDLSGIQIPSIITSAKLDTTNLTLDFELWTPMKSGTQTVYDFAWPADVDEDEIWPTDAEADAGLIGSGEAPGFSVKPPAGHPLNIETNLVQGFSLGPCGTQATHTTYVESQTGYLRERRVTCGNGNGDSFPSDTGDSVRSKTTANDTPAISTSGYSSSTLSRDNTISDILTRLSNVELRAANAQSIANTANEAAAGPGSTTEPIVGYPLPDPDDLAPGTCKNRVDVFINEPLDVTGGKPGVSREIRVDQLYFANECEADQFKKAVDDYYSNTYDAGGFAISTSYPFSAEVTAAGGSCEYTDCDRQEIESGDNVGFAPVPIAYKAIITAGQEENVLNNLYPDAYLPDLVPLFDKSMCEISMEDCDDEGGGGA